MPLEFDTNNGNFAKIKVVGIGGGGGNAVNRMVSYGLQGAEFIVVNTDKQALYLSNSPQKIQIGEKLTKGLGSGGNPDMGRQAAEESRDDIEQALRGADLVFIAAGLGGGTGTGAAPVVAKIAREMNILTIAVVTMPFWFEGKPRMKSAEKGFEQLKDIVDSIIRVPNDKLLEIMGKNTPLLESFKMADDALRQGIQGLTDLIAKPALINLDFADVRAVLSERGIAHMGIGVGSGPNKVVDAARQAVMSPIMDTNIEGARGIIFNITGDETCGLAEVEEAVKFIQDAADPQANYFIGADVDPNLDDEVRITVIATGFGPQQGEKSFDVRDVINSKVNDLSESRKDEPEQNKIRNIDDESGLVLGSGDKDFQGAPESAKEKKRPILLDDEEPDLPVFLRTSPKRLRSDD